MIPDEADMEARLEEYRRLRGAAAAADPLALLEAALFVEEATGIVLREDEIAPENLGSGPAMKRFVAARRERA